MNTCEWNQTPHRRKPRVKPHDGFQHEKEMHFALSIPTMNEGGFRAIPVMQFLVRSCHSESAQWATTKSMASATITNLCFRI